VFWNQEEDEIKRPHRVPSKAIRDEADETQLVGND
jgi:hypothetical protein